MLEDAWYLAHALIAAESIGASQTCLDVSVAYAKERFTFGRAIGSYQAVKHELTDVLRRLENARGLQYYAGWARESAPWAGGCSDCDLIRVGSVIKWVHVSWRDVDLPDLQVIYMRMPRRSR